MKTLVKHYPRFAKSFKLELNNFFKTVLNTDQAEMSHTIGLNWYTMIDEFEEEFFWSMAINRLLGLIYSPYVSKQMEPNVTTKFLKYLRYNLSENRRDYVYHKTAIHQATEYSTRTLQAYTSAFNPAHIPFKPMTSAYDLWTLVQIYNSPLDIDQLISVLWYIIMREANASLSRSDQEHTHLLNWWIENTRL